MNSTQSQRRQPAHHTYQITIKGKLAPEDWENWFEGFEIEGITPSETQLIGPVRDQAQLFAILTKLRDIGITILSVANIDQSTFGEKS